MSETPESVRANIPAETQAAQQPELCFGEVETPKEVQIEMRFEAVETPAETRAETPSQTQVEAHNETLFEIVGTRIETPNEARIETPSETRIEIETPSETQNAMRLATAGTQFEPQLETRPERRAEPRLETWVETRVETPLQTQPETPKETRAQAQPETRVPAQAETRAEEQVETRVEIERVEIERVEIERGEIEKEQQTEKRPVTRPEPQAVTLNDRPFRVKLRGSVLVLIRLPNKRQLRAALHQLSTSGGVINLEKPLDEKIEVELIFHIDRSTIRGKAQMLFPMWATQGWMQPFCFVELTDTDRSALQENLQSFIGNLAKGASAGS
jgi:hypothetical protein